MFDSWMLKSLIKNIEKNGCLKHEKSIEHWLCGQKSNNPDIINIIKTKLIPLIRQEIKNLDQKAELKMKKYIAAFNLWIKSNMSPKELTNVQFDKAKIQEELTKDKSDRIRAEKKIMEMDEQNLLKLLPNWVENQLKKIPLENDRDTTTKKNKKIDKLNKIKKTGLLLDWFGYKGLELVGYGGYNAVWADLKTRKVYKVCFREGKDGLSNDQETNEKIHNLIENNKDATWTKYLNDSKPIDGIRIFESELAEGDLLDITLEHREKKYNRNKTLESFFHKSKNIIKCIIGLHKKNISINDLKLENLLKFSKGKYEENILKNNKEYIKQKGIDGKEHWYKKEKNGNLKRIHKYYVQVSDMGGATNITDEIKNGGKITHTKNWNPDGKDFLQHDEITVKTRDIYPLGLIMLSLLFRRQINKVNKKILEKLETRKYGALLKYLNKIYINDVCENQIKKILILISNMLSSDLRKRPSYAKILEDLQSIEKEYKKIVESVDL